MQRSPRWLLPAQLFTLTFLSPVLSGVGGFSCRGRILSLWSLLSNMPKMHAESLPGSPSLPAFKVTCLGPVNHHWAIPVSVCVWPGLPCVLMC